MKIEHPETGEEIEVFTAEEVDTFKQEALDKSKESFEEEISKEWKEKHSELEKELDDKKRVLAEQTINFKLLRDMTDEEKSKLTAEQIESRHISEKALEENKALKELIESREKINIDNITENEIRKYVGDNEELRKKLEEQISVISIEDPEKKIAAAATLAGIKTNSINPLTQQHSYGSPPLRTENSDDEFLNSERGKKAMEAMGILDNK